MISFSLGENWFNQPCLVVEIFVHVFVMELSYPLEGIMSSFDSKEWRHKQERHISVIKSVLEHSGNGQTQV